MREYGIPAVAEVAPSATLADVVFERADREPQAVMMRRQADGGGPPWRDVTTAQFRAEVTALAKGLIAAGIGTGDRVALLSRTRYEWTLADYAIWSAGAVSVPIYETSSAEQVEWILTDSGARALIAETPAHIEAIAEVLGRLPAVQQIWLIEGAASGDTAAARPLDSLAAEGSPVSDETLAGRRSARVAADLATIIYTSGTTGRPKGCELTHANMLSNVRNAIGALPEIFDHVRAFGPAVPAAGALVRAHHPDRLPRVGHRPGTHPECGQPRGRPGQLPADLHPGRPESVREGVQRGRTAGRGEPG